MKVEVIHEAKQANTNYETRINFIAKLASISYGNDQAKNPKRLVKTLVERGHQSLFEFIRCPVISNHNTYEGYTISESLRHDPYLATYDQLPYDNKVLEDIFCKTLVVLKIETPIFIDRQLVRHRNDSRIEMSRRYVKPDKVSFSYYWPEFMLDKGKEYEKFYQKAYQEIFDMSHRAEVARICLPLNLYTTYYVMRDFVSARNFYVRRFNKHAQRETRELVTKELMILKEEYPDFLGQYVIVVDTFEMVHILELEKYANDLGKDRLLVDYGDPNYYGVFDAEYGLFVDDTPRYEDLAKVLFGIDDE